MDVKRKSYSIGFKLEAIDLAKVSGNRKIAAKFGVDESMIRRWRKQEKSFLEMSNKSRKTKQRYRQPRYPLLDLEIMKWVLALRDKGRQVSGRQILQEARAQAIKMNINFKGSPKWVYKFMKRNNLVRRAVTSVGQHLPANWQEKVSEFQKFVDDKKPGISLSHIGNMDEVAVSFDLPNKFTIAERGSSDIKITTTGHEKCNFTIVLGITADGKKLPPYIIFKRKTIPKGKFPSGVIVSANEKGWMSGAEMELWISKVWSKRPNSFFKRKSILILDAAPGHKTETIKKKLKQQQTAVAIIPGGLTSQLQPLDISVNKSFKSHLKTLWKKWMTDGIKSYTKNGSPKRASYDEIAEWISKAWDSVTVETIKNGFRKTGINFYHKDDMLMPCSNDSLQSIDEEESDEENTSDEESLNIDNEDTQFQLYDILSKGFIAL